MEHYLGEKLKKLRESRGWTQADLAKRLNKAVSTASGYESDAHAIPLDVLASISSLFSISTDELLGLDAPEVLSLSGLTGAQKKTLIKLRNELLSPSQKGNDLSPQQMEILHDIIKAFGLRLIFNTVRVQEYYLDMTLNAGCPVLRVMLFAATPISLQVFSTLIQNRGL